MQQTNLNWEQTQSTAIDLLRFPLAIMVVFIHMNPLTVAPVEATFPLSSALGVENLFYVMFSHVLPHVAVPTFFLISGLLFFWNFRQWSWEGYKKKLKSRLHTLIIPYLLWNILAFGFYAGTEMLKAALGRGSWEGMQAFVSDHGLHFLWDFRILSTGRMDIFGNPLIFTDPIDGPLWFVRDLIVVVILSPLVYCFVKKLRVSGLFLLFIAYETRLWTQLPGFSITALFYFTLGAYFGIYEKNIVQFSYKYKWAIATFTIIAFVASVTFDGSFTTIGNNIYRFYIFPAVFLMFNIATYLHTKHCIEPNKLLLSSTFFIYVVHNIYTIGINRICKKLISYIFPADWHIGSLVEYMVTPFVCVAVCVALYWVFKKIMPRTAAIFTGGR